MKININKMVCFLAFLFTAFSFKVSGQETSETLFQLAKKQSAEGFYAEAIVNLNKAIFITPKVEYLYERALNFAEMKIYQSAINDYKLIASISPSVDAYQYMGICYTKINRCDSAVECFHLALKFDDKNVACWVLWGKCNESANFPTAAIMCYTKALSLEKDPEIYVYRGEVLQSVGEYDLAIDDYNTAISMDVNYIEAYAGRGLTRMELKDFTQALDDINRALAASPNSKQLAEAKFQCQAALRLHQ